MELPPYLFVSFFVFYIFSYLLSKRMGCFSGCWMSFEGIERLFGGIYSAFKCSFDEFVGEKAVSLSYSSAILGLPQSPIIKGHHFLLLVLEGLVGLYRTVNFMSCDTLQYKI